MSQASAFEQFMLELVNSERARTGAQPLAFNASLNAAAETHSRWMLDTDTFSHTGSGGSNAGQRMTAAGYRFTGSWGWAENIAWVSTRAPAGLQDEVALLHTNLMNSPGHRANLLNGSYREIGIGFEQGGYGSWDAGMVTQNFGLTGTGPILTGVAYDDRDGDGAYDAGEGLAGATLTVTEGATGRSFTATTGEAGGYSLALAAGAYATSFAATGFATQVRSVTIGAQNVKLDLADPAATGPGTGPGPLTLTGTSGADVLTGGALADTLSGLAGNDRLSGAEGADRLDGGAGRDTLLGGAGDDLLLGGGDRDQSTGGEGADRFVWASAAEAGRGGTRDQVLDFAQGTDRLDLSAIDANGAAAGDAFAFIGAARFSGAAGQLRYQTIDAARDYTVVQGDLNGDRVADFEIELVGSLLRLSGTDFVL